ncbi:MAG: type III pantothenate kinase [Bacteroidia bacterium]|nr:type III pantothenate kinase [Bacteroidia bacterium]MDW8014730.1 type III pantothenate kinase [Bacteroidia bacterium]
MEGSVLIVDIGNSQVKAAIFSDRGELKQRFLFLSPEELIGFDDMRIFYLDTRMDGSWRRVLAQQGAVELSVEKGFPFPSAYSQRLGADRAAQILAVRESGSWPAVVLSCGTACTIDYIDAQGYHRGGVITAGIHLRLLALAEKTGRLPRIEPRMKAPLLGTDTEEALLAGVVGGFQLEISQWIRQLEMRGGSLRVWVTGGEADFIRSVLPSHSIFAPDLTLRGAWHWQQFLRSCGGN